MARRLRSEAGRTAGERSPDQLEVRDESRDVSLALAAGDTSPRTPAGASPAPARVQSRPSSGDPGAVVAASVTVRRLDDRPLVTIPMTHPGWQDLQVMVQAIPPGAIVRLCPPADASDDTLTNVKRLCKERGAVGTNVVPRPARDAVVVGEEEEPAGEQNVRRTVREIVDEMVAGAHTQDRDALRACVEEAMTAEGV